jgi:O-acetyl-ADP-ribose deacetylase
MVGITADLQKIEIVRGRLEDIVADAIVATLPQTLDWSGALNQSLLAAAGERLDEFVLEHIYQPKIGDFFAVPGFNLKTSHILLTIAPVWDPISLDSHNDRDLLNCYRKPLELAMRMNLRRLAFGALGTGTKSFPPRRAARLAFRGLRERWYRDLESVQIVSPRDDVLIAFAEEMDRV